MAVKTSNLHGNITISNRAIALATNSIARDVYGVVDLVDKTTARKILRVFTFYRYPKGIKIVTENNRIYVTLNAIFKHGVNLQAVAESLKKAVKYGLEEFTGMIVDSVNVRIIGIRV